MLTCVTCHKQISVPVERVNVITDQGSQWCVSCARVSYVDGHPCVLPNSGGLLRDVAYFPRHYSGGYSKWFWQRVANIKNAEDKGTVYFAGVLLQEMEERVVHLLEQVESKGT